MRLVLYWICLCLCFSFYNVAWLTLCFGILRKIERLHLVWMMDSKISVPCHFEALVDGRGVVLHWPQYSIWLQFEREILHSVQFMLCNKLRKSKMSPYVHFLKNWVHFYHSLQISASLCPHLPTFYSYISLVFTHNFCHDCFVQPWPDNVGCSLQIMLCLCIDAEFSTTAWWCIVESRNFHTWWCGYNFCVENLLSG